MPRRRRMARRMPLPRRPQTWTARLRQRTWILSAKAADGDTAAKTADGAGDAPKKAPRMTSSSACPRGRHGSGLGWDAPGGHHLEREVPREELPRDPHLGRQRLRGGGASVPGSGRGSADSNGTCRMCLHGGLCFRRGHRSRCPRGQRPQVLSRRRFAYRMRSRQPLCGLHRRRHHQPGAARGFDLRPHDPYAQGPFV